MDKLLDKSFDAAYCQGTTKDEDGKTICKTYSTYQRNEVAERYQREDGSIYIVIRHKTLEESAKRRQRAATKLERAIADGFAIRDRLGKIKWKKH